MAKPDGPTGAERTLVLGGFAGVALALLLAGQGTETSERALGIIAGLVVALLLWWRLRHR